MIEALSLSQSLGNVLFTGGQVYLLDDPNREPLIVRKILWEKEASIVQDRKGRLFEVGWDSLEFYDDIGFHFPEDE